jgi:hypothetical protein
MDLQINFLTEDSLKMQICEAYWMQAGDGTFVFKVKEIADKYGLQYQGFSKLISQWCQAYSSEDACSECGERFWVFKSRSEYKSRKSSRSAWICSSCRRKKQEEVKQRQASQRTVLLNYYENVGDGVVNVEDIDDRPTTTLKNVVTLLSIIRLTATEDLSHIRPLHTLGDGRLSPTPKYDLDLLKGLTESRVLMPDVTHSSLDAFVFEENNSFSGSYYISM